MAGNIKGITIEFRGDTTRLDSALRKINTETKSIDTELKNVNRALKFNPTSVELWQQKQKLLNDKLKETNEKTKLLKDTLQKVDSGEIEMSADDVSKLKRELIESESKAKALGTQIKQIGNANLKALSEQLKDVGSKLTSVGKSMTTKVTAPIVAGFTVASGYASDYEENLNKLDVAFGDNSKTVKDWANNARKQFGLSKVQATEAASAFGALGKGIGLSEKEAADMSTTLTGLSADLGSYFNVGTDESAKALEGIFTGESEALKKFGVVMTDTNLQDFAKDQGLVWKELDQTQKTMLRYQFVLSKTKDAQGDFARTSDGTANSSKIFKASLQDLGTAIGTNLLPIITPVIQKITQLLDKFNELSPRTQKIITIIGLVAAAIGPVLIVLGAIASGIGSIISLVGMVGPAIGGLAATGGPILLVVGVLAALVAAGVLLYKNWDKIKAAAKALGAKLKEIWTSIKTTTVNTWNAIKTAIVDKVNGFITSVKAKVQAFKTSIKTTWESIKTTAKEKWTSIKEAILSPIETAKDKIKSKLEYLRDFIDGKWDRIKYLTEYYWGKIKDKLLSPIETAKEKITDIIDKIKDLFPINIKNLFSSIKLPHFSWTWQDVGGLISIPDIDVDWYDKGGIFRSPSVIGVGEKRPEFVGALDDLRKIVREESGAAVAPTINIYQQPGQNATDLALEVQRVLVRLQNQRSKAYGNI